MTPGSVEMVQIGEHVFVHAVRVSETLIAPLWETLQIVPSPKVQALLHRALHSPVEVISDAGG